MGNQASRQRQSSSQTAPAQPGVAPAPPAYAPGSGAPGPHYPPAFRPQGPQPTGRPGPPLGPPQQPAQELTKTATIRNRANLKKNTLRLVPLGGDATKLLITFVFDNSAPCIVSTFIGGTEDPEKGCRISSAQAPPPSIQYDQGLGLKFPKPGAEAAHQHIVDMSVHSEALLMAAQGHTFPLIIRLETITEDGIKAGHSVQELEPGAAQKQWVQSQTTFAVLGKGEEGEYEVRVLKQKIWVEGVSYELQEIYGMDQAGGAAAKAELTEAEAEDRLCVICLVNERDTTVLPCRHMCMCHECAQELRKQTQRCPICRNPVESLLHIRLGNKGTAAAGGGSVKGSSKASAAADAAPPAAVPDAAPAIAAS